MTPVEQFLQLGNIISFKITLVSFYGYPMNLSRHESGSWREIWSISWPMILAAMSNYFMILVDRIILSQYSAEAFVAVSGAHPFYWACIRAMIAFMAMTSVFVGQFNGARNNRQIGKVVWQTIFVSFACYFVLIPCAFCTKSLLASNIADLGAPYLSIMLLFLPFHLAGFGAIEAFFLGIGHTRIIPIVILLSNVINVVLDFILIFGWGKIPAMGVHGAAYATGISQLVAFLIFFYAFLNERYRQRFQTHIPKVSLQMMKKCLLPGIPTALNSILNSLGFAIIYQIVAEVCSADDLLAFSIANSIYLFFWFFAEGLGKGLCVICSNYIGQNRLSVVFKTTCSMIYPLLIFSGFTSIFMIIWPRFGLCLFHSGEVTSVFLTNFHWMLLATWISLIAEAFRWMLHNVLISADDIIFTVISNITCFWLMAFTPTFIAIYVLHLGNATLCWQLFMLDSCVRILSNFLRLRSITWKRKAIKVTQMARICPNLE